MTDSRSGISFLRRAAMRRNIAAAQPDPSDFDRCHLDAFVNPFTGKRVDRTRCGVCGAALPLPGDYAMMVERREPHAKLYDCTGDPGSTGKGGSPRLLQTGMEILKPVCPSHLQ